MYPPDIYSTDSISAQRYWEIANQATIPTHVQYLCEFLADDSSLILEEYKQPVLTIILGFEEYAKKNKMFIRRFNKDWKLFSEEKKQIILKEVMNSGVFVFNDRPILFDKTLDEFLSN